MSDERPVEAIRLLELAIELAENGRPRDAEGAYRAVIEVDPTWSAPWYDLGLMYKYEGRWQESLSHNQRAAALAPNDEAAWWNLGIAASVLGEWTEARRAWAAVGYPAPAGDGPPEISVGMAPIRLDPDDVAEVVWATRLDLARARIESVPLPQTSYRFGDIVVHDGAANGTRIADGREYAVFDVLACVQRSVFSTYIVELSAESEPFHVQFENLAHALGGAAEHWGTSTNNLCAACSCGLVHEHHDINGPPAHPDWGVAARDTDHLERILAAWRQHGGRLCVRRWRRSDGALRE
jgi:hypothetical protein